MVRERRAREGLAVSSVRSRARIDASRTTRPWVVAAIVLGVGFGGAIAAGSTAATAVVAVAVVAVIAAVAVTWLAPSSKPPRVDVVPLDDRESSTGTDYRIGRGLWAATALTMLVVAADTQGYTLGGESSIRYGLLVVPLFALLAAAAISNRSPFDEMTTADRLLTVLVTCGVVGSIYGRLVRGTAVPATVIFVPMALGLTHLLVRRPTSAAEASRFQRGLIRVALVFLVLGILARFSFWPLGLPTHVAHERAFFVAIGLAAAWFARRKSILVVILALAAVMFLQYPAATWLIVAMAGVATGFATSRRGRNSAALVLIVFAIGVLGFGVAQVQGGRSSVAKGYFSSVGKGDNTDTRSQLWKAAESQIEKSPLVGSVFTGSFTVNNVDQVISDRGANQQIEPHNDYLEMLLLGGLAGLLLFGAFIISTNVIVIRRIHLLSDQGSRPQRDLARVLLIGFNCALSGAFFNPELSQLGICASIFLIYSLMMTLRPEPTGSVSKPRRAALGTNLAEDR